MKKMMVIKINSIFLVIITLLSFLTISSYSYSTTGDPAECPMINGVLTKDNDQIAKEIKTIGNNTSLKKSLEDRYLKRGYTNGWKGKALDSYIDYMHYEFVSGKCYDKLCEIFIDLCDSVNDQVKKEFDKYGIIEQLLTLLNCGGRKDRLIELAVEKSCDEMRSKLTSSYYNEYRSLCEAAVRWAKKELGKYKKSSLLTN